MRGQATRQKIHFFGTFYFVFELLRGVALTDSRPLNLVIYELRNHKNPVLKEITRLVDTRSICDM